jgi:hypothetical protein
MMTKRTPMMRNVIPPGCAEAMRNAVPSPTKSTGQAQETSGTPKPLVKYRPIATAAMPPKIESGTVTATASGHSVSITYGPPVAQYPPSPITTALPM